MSLVMFGQLKCSEYLRVAASVCNLGVSKFVPLILPGTPAASLKLHVTEELLHLRLQGHSAEQPEGREALLQDRVLWSKGGGGKTQHQGLADREG